MQVGDWVKCAHCKWLHFIVEDGNGTDNCFFCSCKASFMVPGKEGDAPIGSTCQGINIKNFKGESNATKEETPSHGWTAEEVELARCAFQDKSAKKRQE